MTLCIIQARMGSKRLPGKMLRTIGGLSLIEIAYRKACKAFRKRNVFFTIPYSRENHSLLHHLGRFNARGDVWRGDENDVLGRFYEIARHNAQTYDTVIHRWTPDDWRKQPTMCQWVAEGEKGIPVEMGGESFTFAQLKEAHGTVTDPFMREHITYALHLSAPPAPQDGLPWSIDEESDLIAANASVIM